MPRASRRQPDENSACIKDSSADGSTLADVLVVDDHL
jgi:hypothetical protein